MLAISSRASAYYNPLSDFCHALSPDKPVLVAPAGAPIVTPQSLRESHADIFAYQDAVGAGYISYQYTFNPEKRIAMLYEVFARYRDWHVGSGKHLWSDLEIWEMDGSRRYGGSYPASFSRVKRQIEIERKYVQMLTGYAFHGFLQPPGLTSGEADERALRSVSGICRALQTDDFSLTNEGIAVISILMMRRHYESTHSTVVS